MSRRWAIVSIVGFLIIGVIIGSLFTTVYLLRLGRLAPETPVITTTDVQTAGADSIYPTGTTEVFICSQNVHDKSWEVKFRVKNIDDGISKESSWIYSNQTNGSPTCTSFYLGVGHYVALAKAMNTFYGGVDSEPMYFGVIESQISTESVKSTN